MDLSSKLTSHLTNVPLMLTRIPATQPALFLTELLMLVQLFLCSLNRFYTHDQALEAIYQSQRTVLGDNVLKVGSPPLNLWIFGRAVIKFYSPVALIITPIANLLLCGGNYLKPTSKFLMLFQNFDVFIMACN